MIVRARAPLRLSFAGGGSELPPYISRHGGLVLNATINKYAFTTISSTKGNPNFVSLDRDVDFVVKSEHQSNLPPELRLHHGVYKRILQDYNDNEPINVKVSTYCDVPIGSGLGTSSTITVSLVKAFDEFLGLSLTDYQIAELAHKIEREDLGLFGGFQDHYAAAFGGVNYIEFHQSGDITVNSLRINRRIISELEFSIILWFTGVSRDSGTIIEESLSELENHKSNAVERTHKIKASVAPAKDALIKGDIDQLAQIINESWLEKRALQKKISTQSIDATYDQLIKNGALAARISGAGGGGYMLVICKPEKRNYLQKMLQEKNDSILNFSFTNIGAESWVVSR